MVASRKAETNGAASRAALPFGRLRTFGPWWPYVWSVRSSILVGPDGRVPIGTQRLRIQAPPRTRLIHCQLPNGDITILRHHPDHAAKPSILLHLQA